MSLIVDDGIGVYGVPAVLQLAYQSADRQITKVHHDFRLVYHDFRLAAAHVRHLTANISDFLLLVLRNGIASNTLSLANSVDYRMHFCLFRDSRDGGALVTL